MIFGIGNDIVEIKRIEKAVSKESFVKRVYTDLEIEIIKSRGEKNEVFSFAGRFSAKEAVSKALGTGVRDFNIKDIEILENDLHKPIVIFHGNLKDRMKDKKIELSISHSKEYATAVAIVFE